MKKKTRYIPLDEWCESVIPPGANAKAEMLFLRAGMLLSFIVATFLFITRYFAAYYRLFEVVDQVRVLKDNAVMTAFGELTDRIFMGFLLMILCQMIFIGYHYAYFYTGSSKCVYLMRRLPDRLALHKRAVTFPLIVILFSLAMIFVLNLLYYTFYYIYTPAVCLP